MDIDRVIFSGKNFARAILIDKGYTISSTFENYYNERCTVDAKIDTGADMTVISANYAFRNKLNYLKAKQDRTNITPKFANGSFTDKSSPVYPYKFNNLTLSELNLGEKEILVSFDMDNKFLIGNDLLKSLLILGYPIADRAYLQLVKLDTQNITYYKNVLDSLCVRYVQGGYNINPNINPEHIDIHELQEVESF